MELYEQAGVDYSALDSAKLMLLQAAGATSAGPAPLRATALEETRGEPAFVFDAGGSKLAFVLECLGTKSVLAQSYLEQTGRNRFESVGYDAVASIVNDLICVGALPVTLNAYFATGSSAWYNDRSRFSALVRGWSRACIDCGAIWGGGESPSLSGLVTASEIELAGAGVGVFPEGKQPLFGSNIQIGDEIVIYRSSGLHANGASLVRMLGKELEDGLATVLPDGREYGDAALDESLIYAKALEELYRRDVDVHYMSHVTGHGFQKLMRANRDLTYWVDRLPPVPPVLAYIVDRLEMSNMESYSTFNMGAGMVVFVAEGDAESALAAAEECSIGAIRAGVVKEGPRRVVIEPVDEVLSEKQYLAPSAFRSAPVPRSPGLVE